MEERRGIVVGHVDLGEADRIVRVLTAEEGRMDVLAKGARSSRKRFGGLLDLGTRIRFVVERGRGRNLRFANVELVGACIRARSDLDRIALLAYGCEVAGRLAGEGAPSAKLAHLLVVWLDLLEAEPLPGEASRQAFEAKALAFSGVLPSLVTCAVCGRPEPDAFSLESGALHTSCGTGRPAPTASLLRLDVLLRMPLFETPGHSPSDSGWLLSDLVQHQIQGALRSRTLLTTL